MRCSSRVGLRVTAPTAATISQQRRSSRLGAAYVGSLARSSLLSAKTPSTIATAEARTQYHCSSVGTLVVSSSLVCARAVLASAKPTTLSRHKNAPAS
eukprot:scaffold167_cov244-Pinguiococcus_pyrenoidosus.AAC.4